MIGRGGTGGGAGTAGTGNGGTAGTGGTSSPGNEFWVGPNGSDNNPGTQASPFKTITAAHGRVSAGGTIWLLSGTNMLDATNTLSKSGTAAAPIRIQAVAGGARPVLDFSAQAFGSSNRGLNVTGDYWIMRGFEIQKAGDNCIAVSGSNNTFDLLVIHNCGDTGLQITATSSDATNDAKAANNLVAQLRFVREPRPADQRRERRRFRGQAAHRPGQRLPRLPRLEQRRRWLGLLRVR